jgi:hypothetical protein
LAGTARVVSEQEPYELVREANLYLHPLVLMDATRRLCSVWLKRALIARLGLGANQPEDAIDHQNLCDADDNPVRRHPR